MILEALGDREGVIWLDGRYVRWREAGLHVLSHGLPQASTVFDGVRVYGTAPFELAAHCERLAGSALRLGFRLPFPVGAVARACEFVVHLNNIDDGHLRLIAWRGCDQLDIAAREARTHLAIAGWREPSLPAACAPAAVSATWSAWRRPPANAAPHDAKAAGLYATSTLARQLAQDQGFDEALMLDGDGAIADATTANVFLVKEGVLHTPVADCFLAGLTRRTVIALAGDLGLDVAERKVWPSEVDTADEVFLTATAAGITPVVAIGGRRFAPGRVTALISSAYARRVRAANPPATAQVRPPPPRDLQPTPTT